ncbi:MAG: serine/threonine protein kinase [Gemmataceae bacterium]|nr:serine/threonine protein kinase [Gemmataceae bacterium]
MAAPQPQRQPQQPDAPARAPGAFLALASGARPLPEYTLERLLGRGAFGEAWQARGPGGVAVALKFLNLSDRGKLELRSLELIKDIRHPHLLSLFGYWERPPYLILAMELGDRTLLDRLHEVRDQGGAGIPVAELLESLREAAKGIDHLNESGIQHRDIKPHNLLLVGGGVKVADFGLARLLEHNLTTASGCMTPAYAAPELLSGKVANQSDQYSLAVTYCQLRGGRLPFEGNQTQILTAHLMLPPDLSMLPPAEQQVAARALAKDPQRRWPSCRAFVEALAGAVAGPPQPTRGLLVTPLVPSPPVSASVAVPAPPPAPAAPALPRAFRAGFWIAWGVGLLLAGVGLAFLLLQLLFK